MHSNEILITNAVFFVNIEKLNRFLLNENLWRVLQNFFDWPYLVSLGLAWVETGMGALYISILGL